MVLVVVVVQDKLTAIALSLNSRPFINPIHPLIILPPPPPTPQPLFLPPTIFINFTPLLLPPRPASTRACVRAPPSSAPPAPLTAHSSWPGLRMGAYTYGNQGSGKLVGARQARAQAQAGRPLVPAAAQQAGGVAGRAWAWARVRVRGARSL